MSQPTNHQHARLFDPLPLDLPLSSMLVLRLLKFKTGFFEMVLLKTNSVFHQHLLTQQIPMLGLKSRVLLHSRLVPLLPLMRLLLFPLAPLLQQTCVVLAPQFRQFLLQ